MHAKSFGSSVSNAILLFRRDQLFWAGTNKRNNRYGVATIKERPRFPSVVVAAIRETVAPDFPIVVRVGQWKQQDFAVRLGEAALMPQIITCLHISFGAIHYEATASPEFGNCHFSDRWPVWVAPEAFCQARMNINDGEACWPPPGWDRCSRSREAASL